VNKFLPFLLVTALLSGCVYFNTVYNAKTAYDSGVTSYREDERQGRDITNQTKDQFRRAVEKGKKILAEYGDSKYVDDAYLLIGKSYLYLDQAGLAQNYLSDLISNYPNSPFREEARLYLGRSYLQLEEKPLARHEFEYLINNSGENSLRAQAYLALADLEKSDGNSAEMLENVQSAIEIADDNEVKADAAWRTGQWALDHEQYAEAERFFHQAGRFTRKPQFDRQIQVQLARVLRLQEQYDLANDKIQAMLAEEEFNDQYAELEIQRGLIYEAQGDTSKAADTYRYVTSEYSKTNAAASGYFYLGNLAYQRMDYREAQSHYENVSKASSKSEFVAAANNKAGIIGTLQNYRTTRERLQQSLIEAYNKAQAPDTLLTDSTATVESDTFSADSAQEALAKEQLKETLLKDRASEKDTTTAPEITFREIYSWVLEQDSLQTRENYAQALYNLSELFIMDIKRFDHGLILADSVLTVTTSAELKAQTMLLQAYTYQNFLGNPSQAADLIAKVRENYPESEALHLYDIKDQQHQQTTESPPSPEYTKLAQRYHKADSLLSVDAIGVAQDVFRSIYQEEPRSEFGPRSLYAIGWIYENELMELDSAIAKYAEFQSRYADHKMAEKVSERLQSLRAIQTVLTAKPEESDSVARSANPVSPDTSKQTIDIPVESAPESELPTPDE